MNYDEWLAKHHGEEFYAHEDDDSESLNHTVPESVVEEELDRWAQRGDDLETVISRVPEWPMRIGLYAKVEVDVDRVYPGVEQRLLEVLDEEYGHPDCHSNNYVTVPDSALRRLRDAVRICSVQADVYRCEQIGVLELTPDDVRRMFPEEVQAVDTGVEGDQP